MPELTELLGKTKHSQLLIQALLALASIGPAAQPAESAILPHLQMTTDDTVPVAAAYALGAIGAKDADAPLKKALSKKDPFLHMVASWALAKLHPNDQQLMKEAVDELTKGLADEKPQMRTAAAKGLQMLQAPPEMVGTCSDGRCERSGSGRVGQYRECAGRSRRIGSPARRQSAAEPESSPAGTPRADEDRSEGGRCRRCIDCCVERRRPRVSRKGISSPSRQLARRLLLPPKHSSKPFRTTTNACEKVRCMRFAKSVREPKPRPGRS